MFALLLATALALGDTADAPIPRQQSAPISVSVAADGRPLVRIGPVLADEALSEAVRSGLPLRMRFTVELWRDEFIDDLHGSERWSAVLVYDALERVYRVRVQDREALTGSHSSWERARVALESVYSASLRPRRGGRFYYTANLQIETLSLSDLEELELWLRGELAPAVRGEESLPGALQGGVRRALARLLGLPARLYEARSGYFQSRT